MNPIPRENLPHAIAERIIDAVTRGELQPGQQLPAQRQLAKSLGVSIASLRESLHSLTALGLVRMVPGRGTFVSESLDGMLGKQARLAALVSNKDLRDLLEARRYIDVATVELACIRAGEDDIQRLALICDEMQSATASGDMRALEDADLSFHLAVAAAAHNDVLLHLMHSIIGPLQSQITVTAFTEENLAQHLAIFDALRKRDVRAAKVAVEHVIDASARTLGVELDLDPRLRREDPRGSGSSYNSGLTSEK